MDQLPHLREGNVVLLAQGHKLQQCQISKLDPLSPSRAAAGDTFIHHVIMECLLYARPCSRLVMQQGSWSCACGAEERWCGVALLGPGVSILFPWEAGGLRSLDRGGNQGIAGDRPRKLSSELLGRLCGCLSSGHFPLRSAWSAGRHLWELEPSSGLAHA